MKEIMAYIRYASNKQGFRALPLGFYKKPYEYLKQRNIKQSLFPCFLAPFTLSTRPPQAFLITCWCVDATHTKSQG